MKKRKLWVGILLVVLLVSQRVDAAVTGAVAELSTRFHNVSGTVTVVDEDTFRVDNFTYDGLGPAVYFYLGAVNHASAYVNGLGILPILTGTAYDGTQGPLFYDLPNGEVFDDYNGIAVWCVDFSANFGSGEFLLPGDLDGDSFVGLNDLDIILNNWNKSVPNAQIIADPSGDGYVGLDDLDIVLNNWNAGTPPSEVSSVPEPAGLGVIGLLVILTRRRVV